MTTGRIDSEKGPAERVGGPETRARRQSLPLRWLRRLAHLSGFDIVRYPMPRGSSLARLARHLGAQRVDLVFDVGGHIGGYASALRELGFTGRIVSFEPVTAAYELLAARARADPRWIAVKAALGDRDGSADLQVASNMQSSSLLSMLPRHLAAAPDVQVVTTERVRVQRLGSAIEEFAEGQEALFVKMDAQGYERRILEGSGNLLPRVMGLQLEMSLTPLYEGETLIGGMLDFTRHLGFVPVALDPGFRDGATGELLQIDGVFLRPSTTSAGGSAWVAATAGDPRNSLL